MTNTKLWDPVPFMVGGTARHSTNLFRNVAYAAFQGSEGIVSSKDCEVRQLTAPGPQVRVFPGTVAILNRALGSSGEMYVGRLPDPPVGAPDPAPERVDIAPTGSGSGRTDLIVARVENPFQPNETWPTPDDPAVGPYIFTRVIQGVPAGTTSVKSLGLGYSAIPLARVTLPANTTNITQAMITDLRKMTSTRNEKQENVTYPAAIRTMSSSAVWVDWPSDIAFAVDVPEWATHVTGKASLSGVVYGPASSNGYTRILLGSTALGGSTAFDTGATAGGLDRTTIVLGGKKTLVPANVRGTQQTAKLQAYKTSGQVSNLLAYVSSGLTLELTFSVAPETNV